MKTGHQSRRSPPMSGSEISGVYPFDLIRFSNSSSLRRPYPAMITHFSDDGALLRTLSGSTDVRPRDNELSATARPRPRRLLRFLQFQIDSQRISVPVFNSKERS